MCVTFVNLAISVESGPENELPRSSRTCRFESSKRPIGSGPDMLVLTIRSCVMLCQFATLSEIVPESPVLFPRMRLRKDARLYNSSGTSPVSVLSLRYNSSGKRRRQGLVDQTDTLTSLEDMKMLTTHATFQDYRIQGVWVQ